MAKRIFRELANTPSPNGLSARTIRRLSKKNKLFNKDIVSVDAKSRIPNALVNAMRNTTVVITNNGT